MPHPFCLDIKLVIVQILHQYDILLNPTQGYILISVQPSFIPYMAGAMGWILMGFTYPQIEGVYNSCSKICTRACAPRNSYQLNKRNAWLCFTFFPGNGNQLQVSVKYMSLHLWDYVYQALSHMLLCCTALSGFLQTSWVPIWVQENNFLAQLAITWCSYKEKQSSYQFYVIYHNIYIHRMDG